MEKGNYGRAIGIFTVYMAMHKEESKQIKNENKTTRDYYLSWGPQNRAWCYIQLKNYGKAIDDLTEAIKLRPTYALNFENRAQCYQLTDRPDLAKNDLVTAKKLSREYLDDEDQNTFFKFSPVKRH